MRSRRTALSIGGESYADPDVYQTCDGGEEGLHAVGEGPCNPTTDLCQNSTTEGLTGPMACPTDDADSGVLCEYADGYCFPQGPRPVTINGVAAKETWPVAGCNADQYQNGDLDFDGISYHPDTWPNGTPNQPTAASYIGPFTGGKAYPNPFWSLNDSQRLFPLRTPPGTCIWNFGNVLPGVTTESFGHDADYGQPDIARYGGTIIGSPMPNPEFGGGCRARRS